MRTVETTLYHYGELSESAQERARDNARSSGWVGDAWNQEWRESLERAYAALDFPAGEAPDWEVSRYSGSYCRLPEHENSNLAGVRAWKFIQANYARVLADCPFTGYCGDDAFLDPLRAFLKRPTAATLQEVFQDCADSWAQAFEADIVSQFEDEYVADFLHANNYEFTESGALA